MAGSGTLHLREDALLTAENLTQEFKLRSGGVVQAVSNISLDIGQGETLGIVGESGCGKSTTGKAIMQLPRPTSGSVRFDGTELTELRGNSLRAMRPRLQMIFQDPISSLNPRRTVHDIVAEPLKIWTDRAPSDPDRHVSDVLESVGVDPEMAKVRKPHEYSGGQCQRVSIARAVVTNPGLIICDEPVSALDVSVQAQILNLLEDMKSQYGLTLAFIAHDLAVVKNVSDRVAVMYLGKICEVGGPDELFARPAHPYTQALIDAIPKPDPTVDPTDAARLEGDLPSPLNPPSGCRFRTRCPRAEDLCRQAEPQMTEVHAGHYVACHFPLETAVEAPTAGATTV